MSEGQQIKQIQTVSGGQPSTSNYNQGINLSE